MATRGEPKRGGGGSSPQNRSEAALIGELAEVHTALGFHLAAMKLMIGRSAPAPLIKAIDDSIAQSERADKALRRLRRLLQRRQRAQP